MLENLQVRKFQVRGKLRVGETWKSEKFEIAESPSERTQSQGKTRYWRNWTSEKFEVTKSPGEKLQLRGRRKRNSLLEKLDVGEIRGHKISREETPCQRKTR